MKISNLSTLAVLTFVVSDVYTGERNGVFAVENAATATVALPVMANWALKSRVTRKLKKNHPTIGNVAKTAAQIESQNNSIRQLLNDNKSKLN
jgi:hypothetical protein